jgi:tetratricopeptide (TPR) repeat protein
MIHDNDPSFWQFHLENARTMGNRELEAVALTNLGASYAYSEQYERALDRYHQAIPIFQELGDRNREIWALNNIGTTYDHLTQYNRAIAVYLKAIAVSRSAGTLVREGWVLRSLAHTYRSMMRLPH